MENEDSSTSVSLNQIPGFSEEQQAFAQAIVDSMIVSVESGKTGSKGESGTSGSQGAKGDKGDTPTFSTKQFSIPASVEYYDITLPDPDNEVEEFIFAIELPAGGVADPDTEGYIGIGTIQHITADSYRVWFIFSADVAGSPPTTPHDEFRMNVSWFD